MTKTLILASSSINRFELLKRLQLDFQVIKPQVDETGLKGESAKKLVIRLAKKKADSGYNQFINKRKISQFWVIGSDQVLEVNGQIFGKPHNIETAIKQLTFFSNQTALFHTSICLIHKNNQDRNIQIDNILTKVIFKKLSQKEIETYLKKEDALNCAGSFKSEGLGLSLLSSIKSSDHSAIIGLPLIRLSQMLAQTGFNVL